MTWILLLTCIFLILTDNKKIVPVYIISSMWINFDVRCGPISFISLLSVFIIVLGFFTRKKNLIYKTNIDSLVTTYFIYAVLIYIPFILLSTDISVVNQLNNLKSKLLSIIFLLVIWKWKSYNRHVFKKQGLYIEVSIILLCLYGIYTYLSMTNPYMDIMGQYCSNENLSDLLARSMEDARGNLHGRITGTSLYTIQYGILLVIIFFLFYVLQFWHNSKNFTIIIGLLILLNIYLTGSRGPLGALLVGFAFYLMRALNRKKKFIYSLILLFVIFFGWPYLESYLSLFTSNDIEGSSFEMRSVQFTGALSMVANDWQSLLFGKGIGYTSYYLEHFGRHPFALYFESTHVAGIVNYGILGLFLTFICNVLFLFYIAKKTYERNMITQNAYYLLISYLITYFIYNVLVGDVYSTLFLFVFFMILKQSIIQNNNLKIQNV